MERLWHILWKESTFASASGLAWGMKDSRTVRVVVCARRSMELLLETLPNAKSSDLESLLPWSETLPERCKTVGDSGRPTHRSVIS
ncbi:MAG: hypothetical protein LBO81_04205 [Clostridiales Family XIII bacterium]|nr:hypothetical protein [Clostridiales Family XIII bacterium]